MTERRLSSRDATRMPAPPPSNPDTPPFPTESLSAAEEVFERWRRIAGAVLAPIAFGLTFYFTSEHLTPQGRTRSAILAAVCVLWVSEALPLPVTALLGAVLCAVLGVAPVKTVLSYFADPIVFVFTSATPSTAQRTA